MMAFVGTAARAAPYVTTAWGGALVGAGTAVGSPLVLLIGAVMLVAGAVQIAARWWP